MDIFPERSYLYPHCWDPCQRMPATLFTAVKYRKPTLRQLRSTKPQKTAQCCLLFHRFLPCLLPFCGSDWLCCTLCANIQEKPNGSPAQKHYPALWWAPGPAHPVHNSHRRPTISAATLLCVWSQWWESWQACRRTGHGVNALMACPITSNTHTCQ